MPYKGGVFLAATASGAGKTATSLGLISALRARGHAVQPAKAGPDFLDAAWLGASAGRPCPNVDSFMAPDGNWRL